MIPGRSAHLRRRLQARAERWTARVAEDGATVGVRQLDTAHAGRLAVRHTRNRRGDRGSGAARAASCTAADLVSTGGHRQQKNEGAPVYIGLPVTRALPEPVRCPGGYPVIAIQVQTLPGSTKFSVGRGCPRGPATVQAPCRIQDTGRAPHAGSPDASGRCRPFLRAQVAGKGVCRIVSFRSPENQYLNKPAPA